MRTVWSPIVMAGKPGKGVGTVKAVAGSSRSRSTGELVLTHKRWMVKSVLKNWLAFNDTINSVEVSEKTRLPLFASRSSVLDWKKKNRTYINTHLFGITLPVYSMYIIHTCKHSIQPANINQTYQHESSVFNEEVVHSGKSRHLCETRLTKSSWNTRYVLVKCE